MDELIEKSKELVLKNIKDGTNSDIIEVFSAATLALILIKPSITLERLPKILKELNILVDEKSVLEISHEKLNNYSEDRNLAKAGAAVTRTLTIDDESKEFIEERTFILSLNELKHSPVELIEKTAHELIHLLRFGGVEKQLDYLKIRDGISINYVDINTFAVKRKHYNLEEGIVQRYTNMALSQLGEYLKDLNISNNYLLGKINKKLPAYKFSSYILQTHFLDILCQNERFNQLIDDTFNVTLAQPELVKYFNSVMENSSSFTRFSKMFDKCQDDITDNNIANIKQCITPLQDMTKEFMIKSRFHR